MGEEYERTGSCCLFPMLSIDISKKWQHSRNKEIDSKIKKEKCKRRKCHMLLLLGTGESGKSTFLKQMKIINGHRFTPQEIQNFKDIIYDNIYKGTLFLLKARADLNIPWSNGFQSEAAIASHEVETHYKTFHSVRRDRLTRGQHRWKEDEFLELVEWFRKIWRDESIRRVFHFRSKIITEDFSENTRFYLDRLDTIGVRNYTPSNEEIVWLRHPTTTVVEEKIEMDNATLIFIDVGGQTKERRKWCQFFCDVTSVLFLIACSHFDEHYQDKLTKEYRNKLRESMVVFSGLINHVAFKNVSIIIFFNKIDILKEKLLLQHSDIKKEFPNYPKNLSSYDLQSVQTFMVHAFSSLISHSFDPPTISHKDRIYKESNSVCAAERDTSTRKTISSGLSTRNSMNPIRRRRIYKHFTTAVNKDNIENVFVAMQDAILQNNLRRIMMS